MRIELQWAFSEEDMRAVPCAICEAEFKPRAVLIHCDPHGEEACEECLRALSGRKATLPDAPWPAWEEYRALAENRPEPMFASAEEVAASERAGDRGRGEWPAYDASWLWQVSESGAEAEEDIHIVPTVLYRIDQGGERLTVAVVERPGFAGRALIVFRSEEEAEKYRHDTGKQPEGEGFKPVALDLDELKDVLDIHGCTHVAMPEPWTGKGDVDFFDASAFIGMLRDSVSA